MITESGEQFQTLFDEKRLYRLLSTEEQKDGIFIFKAELLFKEERARNNEASEETDLADVWTGCCRGITKKENVIYPIWG
jgi:hypothetical protein